MEQAGLDEKYVKMTSRNEQEKLIHGCVNIRKELNLL